MLDGEAVLAEPHRPQRMRGADSVNGRQPTNQFVSVELTYRDGSISEI